MYKTQLAWQWMSSQESFTAAEVANAVEMPLEQCRTSINKLKKQGFITHVSGLGVSGHAKRYVVNQQVNHTPRLGKGARLGDKVTRQGKTGQQLIWNTLRINPVVTVNTVVAVTGCQAKSVSLYLLQLEKAGYLYSKKVDTRLANSEICGQEALWRLKPTSDTQPGNTGPKAPILRRGRGMFDQNRQQFYPFGPAPSIRKNAVQGATRSDGRLSDSHLQEPTPCNG